MIEPTWIDDFDEVDSPWLIDGFVCPSLTIISAQPKHGKTLLAGHIAISLITGQPLAGRVVKEDAHLVAWMGFDPGWKQDIRDNWASEANNRILFYPTIRNHNPEIWKTLLESLIAKKATVFVIDHLYGLAGPIGLNDAENVAKLFTLIRPIYESGISVILISQAGKSEWSEGRSAHSVAIEAEARSLIRIYNKKINGVRKIKLISNSRGEETFNVILTPEEFSIFEAPEKKKVIRESPNEVRKALKNAKPEELTNWSAFGRGLVRLRLTKNENSGRTKSSRWREQSLIKKEDGVIVAGDSLLPEELLSNYQSINTT
jgi:hypothetical protein